MGRPPRPRPSHPSSPQPQPEAPPSHLFATDREPGANSSGSLGGEKGKEKSRSRDHRSGSPSQLEGRTSSQAVSFRPWDPPPPLPAGLDLGLGLGLGSGGSGSGVWAGPLQLRRPLPAAAAAAAEPGIDSSSGDSSSSDLSSSSSSGRNSGGAPAGTAAAEDPVVDAPPPILPLALQSAAEVLAGVGSLLTHRAQRPAVASGAHDPEGAGCECGGGGVASSSSRIARLVGGRGPCTSSELAAGEEGGEEEGEEGESRLRASASSVSMRPRPTAAAPLEDQPARPVAGAAPSAAVVAAVASVGGGVQKQQQPAATTFATAAAPGGSMSPGPRVWPSHGGRGSREDLQQL